VTIIAALVNDSEFLDTHGSPPVHHDNDHLQSEVGGKFYLSPDQNPFHTHARAQTIHDLIHRKFSAVIAHKNLITGLLLKRCNTDANGKVLAHKLPCDFIKKMFNCLMLQTFLGLLTCTIINVVVWESRHELEIDHALLSRTHWILFTILLITTLLGLSDFVQKHKALTYSLYITISL
jgi:hypothetical protein